MFSRLIFALVLAVAALLPTMARTLDAEYAYILRVRMKTSSAGWIQVFADVGHGYSEQFSSIAPLAPGDELREYRLSLPAGRYVGLRLDPGVSASRYEIVDAAVLDAAGTVVANIPLASLIPVPPLVTISRGETSLIVETGSPDPQLLYTPADALWLLPLTNDVPDLVRRLLLQTSIAFVALWLLELVFARVAKTIARQVGVAASAASAHPWISVAVAAFASTVVACYPTLFLGRSLVSPNNGPVPMLYGQPPFVFDSGDSLTENIRNSDVGSMMWAFAPYSHVQRMAIGEGELPLWNRYNSVGVPLWGQGQGFMLDPLHWIALLRPDPAPGWDLKFAAHRFVAAWGVGVAALVAVGAAAPASLAAASAAFVGIYIFRFNHPAVFVMAYAPWILAGWFLLAQAVTRTACARAALLITIASTLLLSASPPKEGACALLVVWTAGVLAVLLAGYAGKAWRRRLGAATVAGVSTLLLTTPLWLIFLDTLSSSVTYYDVPAVRFADRELALSMALGPLAPYPLGPGLNTVTGAFVVAALLSPGLLLAHRCILACTLATLAAIAIAYGAIPADVIVQLPLAANIHRLDLTLLTATLAPLSIVAALGVHAILNASRRKAAVLTAGIAVGAALVFGEIGGTKAVGGFEGWFALLVLVGAVLVPTSVRVAAGSFPRVLPIISTIALAALLLSPGGQHVETGTPALDRILLQPRARVLLASASPVVEAIEHARTEPARVLGLGVNLFPGTPAFYRLEGVEGPDALLSPSLRELFDAAGAPMVTGWKRTFSRDDVERLSTALDLLNVEFVAGSIDELAPGDRTLPMRGPDLLQAIRRASAWPRAFFIDRVASYATAGDLLSQAHQAGRPIAALLRDDARANEITREVPMGAGEVVRAERYTLTTNTTTFHLRAPRAGVTVLTESYMPEDFIATLNGQPVPYFRVNHAFKGVVIPSAGDWEVRFEYRPKRWGLALAMAAVGALMLIGLAVSALGLRLRRTYNEKPAAFASS